MYFEKQKKANYLKKLKRNYLDEWDRLYQAFCIKMTLIAGILRKNSQILSSMHISIIYTID